jgi:cell division protein FtsZ
MAVASPLLEASIDGAHGVLLSIAGGSDLGLFEVNEAAALVADAVHPDANIIFGTIIDDSLGDEVKITVIAAGFDGGHPKKRETSLRGEPLRQQAQVPQQVQSQPSAPVQQPPRIEFDNTSHIPRVPANVGAQPAQQVTYSDDELDVPDFLK